MAYPARNDMPMHSMQPYQDNPGGGHPDLQDYYDETGVPPAHRLSDYSTPLNSFSSSSNLPLVQDSSAAGRGAYTEVLPTGSTGNLHDMSAQARGYSDIDAPYNQSGNSNWLEKQESRGKRSRWIVIGSVLGLVGLIAIGVALGVTLSKKSSSKTSSSSTSGVVNQTDPNDPSTFEKNPNLHQSFYGIAYTPEGSQYPACGNSLDQVITDIQLLSQLTTRIRLYGADCNQSALVLEAIKQTKVNLTVWLANYNIPTDDTPYTRQKAAIQSAIQTYGTDHIGGVTVGNEYMLNYLNANGATDPNSAVGNQGAALLINDINDTRYMLGNMSLSKTPPVGTAEAGSYFNTLVLQDVDYGMSNVHPWFANVSIDQSAAWTWEFFEEQNVQPAAALSNTPQMYIAETGWPSNSSDAGNESNGPSTASTANLQTFIDTFVCQANANGTEYFYFEYFDEIWKDIQFGGVEGWWGLFYSNRTLKPITIPDCQSP